MVAKGASMEKRTITFRIGVDVIRALRVRGAMNDRSANGELCAILEKVLKIGKAPKHGLENRSDASHAE